MPFRKAKEKLQNLRNNSHFEIYCNCFRFFTFTLNSVEENMGLAVARESN